VEDFKNHRQLVTSKLPADHNSSLRLCRAFCILLCPSLAATRSDSDLGRIPAYQHIAFYTPNDNTTVKNGSTLTIQNSSISSFMFRLTIQKYYASFEKDKNQLVAL
jgi:hypothetical protein